MLFLSGTNYEPYENFLREHLGRDILIMENYSATEGNFAYQVVPGTKGMELICNQGIFYEFIPLEEINKNNPVRLSLAQVQTGKQYALIISNTHTGRAGQLLQHVTNQTILFLIL